MRVEPVICCSCLGDIPTENNPSLLCPKCGMANIPKVPPGQLPPPETLRLPVAQAEKIRVTISRVDDPFPGGSRLDPSGLRRRVCIPTERTKAKLRLAIRTAEQIVRFSCYQCQKRVETNALAAGQYISCPYCGCGLVVPSA